ncbi:hypothetical protein jhhlp_004691 [Lomentospora prolificans]|uniref:Beta-xylosidase C-terminal Concanavalin A-like domain-containing protein n=1 Tax=Lomentospora prolificans TaxID=41688 RepID=A0A2N3NC74_9PEZI|nr:hypothetical protein jhhlp_004691 [Lomentospora prolificans]
MQRRAFSWATLSLLLGSAVAQPLNSTYHNPVLPGWHSDPSCVHVNGTFYCATSTFIAFPGLPVYASRDLVNWKLASHAWSRESQLPGLSWRTVGQQEGMFAPTLRYRDGEFYLVCEYLGMEEGIVGVVFKTADIFEDAGWSDPVTFSPTRIDPDLFWDDEEGKVYAATQGIILQELDLETGELSEPPIELWNGTGGVWPEGPHFYKKDGWYYLMIAEGGTATDHAVTIARSRNITGPYESNPANPILTNRGTDEYFQTVGHADLFQDGDGNWWGMSLATRSGPKYQIYPMGREAVLFPVTWEEGEWPVMAPVRGEMSGWALPPATREVPGHGPFNSDPDAYDFDEAGSGLPRHFMHWRVPKEGTFSVTKEGLEIVASRNNLTGVLGLGETDELSGRRGLAFVGRRQTHTLFDFTVDLVARPKGDNVEAGVTVFLTQLNHIDLGVVRLPGEPPRRKKSKRQVQDGQSSLSLRFRAEGTGTHPQDEIVPVPDSWAEAEGAIRLRIRAVSPVEYELSALLADDPESEIVVARASGELLSGGTGSFVGSLVGVYATCNGEGSGGECPGDAKATFRRWRYDGEAQYISATESVAAEPAEG